MSSDVDAWTKFRPTAFTPEYQQTPMPSMLPPAPRGALTDYDVVRIVRAVLEVLDEREQPSPLAVTAADIKRWMP